MTRPVPNRARYLGNNGAADDGIGHAFDLSLIQLAVVAAGIVVASRLLPARPARA